MNQKKSIEKNSWINRMMDLIQNYVGLVLCVVIGVSVFVVTMVAFHNGDTWNLSWSADKNAWGVFGDFIGGVVGTLVAVFSVYYLIRTLLEQQDANKKFSDNNRSMAEIYQAQQFDNNYQHLIRLYEESINGYGDEKINGRRALKKKAMHLFDFPFDDTTNYQKRMEQASVLFDSEFYIPNRIVAAVHFRILFQIFNLINNSSLDEKKYKVPYAKLIRSQIDEEELLLIRYNCWCQYGINMRKLVNHYNVLKHMPLLNLLEFKYWRMNVIKDTISQNALDTELIRQRKWIIEKFSQSLDQDREFSLKISSKYELQLFIGNNRCYFKYHLIQHNNEIASLSIDTALDSLGDIHMCNFICDFLHELFEYSNFNEYNSDAKISYVSSPVSYDKDRSLSNFIVELQAIRPLILQYVDLVIGVQESSPIKISNASHSFFSMSRIKFSH